MYTDTLDGPESEQPLSFIFISQNKVCNTGTAIPAVLVEVRVGGGGGSEG